MKTTELVFYLLKRRERREKLMMHVLARRHKRMRALMRARRAFQARCSLILEQLHSTKIELTSLSKPRIRRFRSQPRNDEYWAHLIDPSNENMFFEHFRMSRKSFSDLCNLLSPHLPKQKVGLTIPVPLEKQVAICIYTLASCDEYRLIGDIFGVHKSTVHKYFHIVITAILKLTQDFIGFPKFDECQQIADEFEKISHIPNIIGVIDTTHMPVNAYTNYVNGNGWPSMIMQAVVDNKCLFRDVSIKFPGSVHSDIAFRKSGFYKNHQSVIPKFQRMIDNVEMPFILLGSPSYPLLHWLLTPYTGKLTPEEQSYNNHLNSASIVVRNAFERLKGRWMYLSKKIHIDPKFLPYVVLACATLHNYLEMKKERYMDNPDLTTCGLQQPTELPNDEVEVKAGISSRVLRQKIKKYLVNNYNIPKSTM